MRSLSRSNRLENTATYAMTMTMRQNLISQAFHFSDEELGGVKLPSSL